MKILLANLAQPHNNFPRSSLQERLLSALHFPIGLGIIAHILKRIGREFDSYDSYTYGTTEGFFEKVEQGQIDTILLSGFLGNYSYPFFKTLSHQLKALNPSCKIIMGGAMASTIPELLVSRTSIDVAVIGEGERTIVELLNTIENDQDLGEVQGIAFKDDKSNAVITAPRERITHLDSSSFPYYKAFPVTQYLEYLEKTDRCWEIIASRGCSWRCTFCKRAFSGQKVTSYPPKLILDHMVEVSDKYGINKFSFVDDNFLNSPKKALEFVDVLQKQPYSFQWRFQARADHISPEMIEKLVNVGLFDISFGLESGSQEMLNRYNKRLDIRKAIANLEAIQGMVDIHASLIVGGPGETWNTIKETERLIKRLRLKASIGILTPFPGSPVYMQALHDGLIVDEEEYCMNLGPIYVKPYVNVSSLSDDELLKAREILQEASDAFGAYETQKDTSAS